MEALLIKELKKEYPNGVVALNGIHLSVAKGDFFALLGPNGAGKTTTIGIICSLINKTSGSISVFGHDLDTDLEAAKSCIGVVPQEMNFNPFEKISHIVINQAGYYGIPRKVATERAMHYLNVLGLDHKKDQTALRLSGGMKRRLMIARALVNDPKLLILDEPTAGVDIELRHGLWEFLTKLNNDGTTIILTTHYLEEAEQLCKNIAIIDHGEIIENANMKSLLNRLHIQTFVIDFVEPLSTLPFLPNYTYRMIDNSTMEIVLQKDQLLNDLFEEFNTQQIKVNSMRNKTNRLEELFVNLIKENKAKKA